VGEACLLWLSHKRERPLLKVVAHLIEPVANVVDRYVFNPAKSSANVVLNATQGALRFAGGKIEQMHTKNIIVNTPNAALAVRGTHFWAGRVKGKYGVLLLKGKVRVSKR
jgi:hypothetical protein